MASTTVGDMAPPPIPVHQIDDDELTDDDDDPITAEYDVYITPQMAASASLYLLQFPTREREQPYNDANDNAPLELRMKPKSGFLEMEVPLNHHINFDQGKAETWGSALAKTKSDGGHSYGLAGGFAMNTALRGQGNAKGGGGRGGRAQQDNQDRDEPEGDHMMRSQTLGGQIIKDDRGRPNYMIGAFRGAELHLTPVNGIIQMRPQFHHIDAKNLVDRSTLRKSREAAGDASATARPAEPRIVQMMAKGNSSTEAENLEGQSESTKEHLTKATEEGWTRLQWVDEEADKAYEAYHTSLFLQETARAPKLVASMQDDTYLDEISAPRLDPSGKKILRPMHRKSRGATIAIEDVDEEEAEDEEEDGLHVNGEAHDLTTSEDVAMQE